MRGKLSASLAGLAVVVGAVVACLMLPTTACPWTPGALNASLQPLAARSVDPDADFAAGAPVAKDYNLGLHETLSRVIVLIRENYVEPDRIRPHDMFMAALDFIQKTQPEVMIDDAQAPKRVVVSVGNVSRVLSFAAIDQLWQVTLSLREVFRFLQTQIKDPTARRDIEYAAINGMLSTLDPHSVLLKPESFDEVKMTTKGEFGGLGIVISIRDGSLTVMSPIDGTPASRAGIHAKDKIVKIGEESTVNMGLDEAVQRLRGRPGAEVTMWISRKSWSEPRAFTMARAIIKIESVTSELLPEGIGYVKIKSFQGNTYDDLKAHLGRLKKKNHNAELKGLVLDLRNNPGGLLDQAIMVSDRFLEDGPIVITVGEGNKKREVKQARYSGDESAFPMAVLVNGGSASASEIVSGALKNRDRAVVIGQQSFGKGSVQVLYDFKDHSALKLTIAQYLTPGDLSIQSVGITPDVQIMPAMLGKDGIHLFVDDDSPREKDLERHLDQRGATSVVAASEAKITHLIATPDADGEDPVVLDRFEYDFETRIAHDLLVASTTPARLPLLRGATALLQQRADGEEARIAERLRELGVDWAAPSTADAQPGQAPAGVRAALVPTGGRRPSTPAAPSTPAGGEEPIAAGGTMRLTATVHNDGPAPLHRAWGVTTSDNPLLKGHEFVFGHIAAGEARQWHVDIKIPSDMVARADEVTLALSDAGGHAKEVRARAFVTIAEQPRPRFGFTVAIDDFRAGNGDGTLQAGEQAELVVNVHNLGPGIADDVTVTVKNLSGKNVFLEQGRAKVGTIAVNGQREARMRFVVKGALDEVKLKLMMWDAGFGATMSEDIRLPVAPARAPHTRRQRVRVDAPAGATLFSGAAARAPAAAHAAQGTVLVADAEFDGWLRVPSGGSAGEAGAQRPAFVRRHDVIAAAEGAPAGGPITAERPVVAPTVEADLAGMVVSGPTLPLSARVASARQLKDVFVFVNNKKVYYRALNDLPQTPAGVQSEIAVALPLKVGANEIAIIAREDDSMVGRKLFGVFRRDQAPAAEQRAAPQPGALAP